MDTMPLSPVTLDTPYKAQRYGHVAPMDNGVEHNQLVHSQVVMQCLNSYNGLFTVYVHRHSLLIYFVTNGPLSIFNEF